jgi:hypothetical protein
VSYQPRPAEDTAHSGERVLAVRTGERIRRPSGRRSSGRRAGRRAPLLRWLGAAAAGAVLVAAVPLSGALGAPAAEAGSVQPCTARTTTTPFTAFGDGNAYFTVPGGTFEDGVAGWTLLGAGVVRGNEPWRVLGAGHSSSLGLSPGGAATTPAMCIATDEDAVRFFYRAPAARSARLKVTIHVTSGVNAVDHTYEVAGGACAWRLSDRIMLPDLRDATGRQTVTITFAATGSPAPWLVDDVEIDPWRSL